MGGANVKEWVNGKVQEMTPQAEKAYIEQKQAFEAAMAGASNDTARIAELEARLTRYEDNEKATNILLGVTE